VRQANEAMSEPAFAYDVFLSHSSKDKAVVRPLAERLRKDESEPQPSSFLLHPFQSAPLNQKRRFIPLRLDEAPVKGSPAQYFYINWRQSAHKRVGMSGKNCSSRSNQLKRKRLDGPTTADLTGA